MGKRGWSPVFAPQHQPSIELGMKLGASKLDDRVGWIGTYTGKPSLHDL